MISVERKLARLKAAGLGPALLRGRVGLEKETLRVARDGGISQAPHPIGLGSPLTHPYITTDYSEALLELITPPMDSVPEALGFLSDLHRFVYSRLEREFLWATSMPCILAGPQSIPIARYGDSNAGRMKTVYRRGLGYRYGHIMQVIAGVHFNFSLPEAFWSFYVGALAPGSARREFIDDAYFALIRNLLRLGWLVPYLFGASPAVCRTFMDGKPTTMPEFDESSYYEPYATSLRLGDIGYQNSREWGVGVKASYDSLAAYLESLNKAISTPCADYERIGVVVDGEYRQLNANILQIENEYYSTVRPKQTPARMEKPILALQRRGVSYVELRSLDVNAFHPLGIDETQLYFLQALMVYCLLRDSPPVDEEERREVDSNQAAVAHRGRDPDLRLLRRGREVGLGIWASEVFEEMEAVCLAMDGDDEAGPFSLSLAALAPLVSNADLTPSARMLAEMRENDESFYRFARRKSMEHLRAIRNIDAPLASGPRLAALVASSIEEQRAIEAADRLEFDAFLADYFAQS